MHQTENILLAVLAIVFLVSGSMLLISFGAFKRISDITNKLLFTLDDKLGQIRRPVGLFFLALAIFLWYVAWWK